MPENEKMKENEKMLEIKAELDALNQLRGPQFRNIMKNQAYRLDNILVIVLKTLKIFEGETEIIEIKSPGHNQPKYVYFYC